MLHQEQPDSHSSDFGRQTIRRLSNCRSDEPRQGLTFSRGWLIHISKDTLQIAESGKYENRHGKTVSIKDDFNYAMKHSKHYHSSHEFYPQETTQPMFDITEFYVCYGSSLQVASKLNDILESRDTKFEIGILNSASGKYPDKFLRGTLSQEEGFCRASLLYPCLAQYKDRPHHFYYINHKPKYIESSSSCAIYCPQVPVIREDSVRGDYLDTPLKVSFVSIPAPNAFVLGGNASDDEGDEHRPARVPKAQPIGASEAGEAYENMTVTSAMYDRLFRALSIFAEQGCTDLVLCAFGCGVHGNDPKKIAQAIKTILANELKGRFRVVTFAIQASRVSNFDAFVEVFGPNVACCVTDM